MIRYVLLATGVSLVVAFQPLPAQQFLGRSPVEWAAQLKTNIDAKERRNAAFALGKIGNRAVTVLTDMRVAYGSEKNAKVKEAIVFAMGEICRESVAANNDAALEQLFIAALREDDMYLRRSAAFAVRRSRNGDADADGSNTPARWPASTTHNAHGRPRFVTT